jgi:hypothetical protein
VLGQDDDAVVVPVGGSDRLSAPRGCHEPQIRLRHVRVPICRL